MIHEDTFSFTELVILVCLKEHPDPRLVYGVDSDVYFLLGSLSLQRLWHRGEKT